MTARRTSLATLAIALLAAVAQPADAQFDLSLVQGFISDLRSGIDLPPSAEAAIDQALGRADSVLDQLFGDQDSADTPGTPNGDTPTDMPSSDPPVIDTVVDGFLDQAQQAVEQAQARAQAAIDEALSRAGSFLGALNINLPSINLPNIDLPNFDLPNLDLPNIDLPNIDLPNLDLPDLTLPEIDLPQIDLPDLLDDLDLPALIPDVTPIVDQPIEDVVDDVIDEVAGVIDGLDGPIVDVIDDVLDSSDPLGTIIESLPIDSLPAIAQEAIESVIGRFLSAPTPLPSVAAAVPEPGALSLLAIGLLSGGVARRRR